VELYEHQPAWCDCHRLCLSVKVEGRYVMTRRRSRSSNTQRLEMQVSSCLVAGVKQAHLCGAALYQGSSVWDFDGTTRSRPTKADHACDLCGATGQLSGECIMDDAGGRDVHVFGSDYCGSRRAAGHSGAQGTPLAGDAAWTPVVASGGIAQDVRRAERVHGCVL